MTRDDIEEAIAIATDLIRRWDLQERGSANPGEERIRDRDVVAAVRTLVSAKEIAPLADRQSIQRLIELTEARLNFVGRRGEEMLN